MLFLNSVYSPILVFPSQALFTLPSLWSQVRSQATTSWEFSVTAEWYRITHMLPLTSSSISSIEGSNEGTAWTVAIVEGLLMALLPSYLRAALEMIAALDPERRRLLGLLAVTVGVALVWVARA